MQLFSIDVAPIVALGLGAAPVLLPVAALATRIAALQPADVFPRLRRGRGGSDLLAVVLEAQVQVLRTAAEGLEVESRRTALSS